MLRISMSAIPSVTPPTARRFFDLIASKYGKGPLGVVRAWMACFDTLGTGQIKTEDFKGGCDMIGFTGDTDKLFGWLL